VSDSSTVVFTGPSISTAEVRDRLPGCTVLPPVARGHLYSARQNGADTLLIIDGTFSHGFAISPREVIDVARDGATVYGASSMGAIRAAECHPAGVRGIGVVFRLYRTGILDTDDEVAVATDPDDGYAATSCALVNVRCAARRAVARRLLGRADERAIVAAAQGLHFARRRWPVILRSAAVPGDRRLIQEFCERVDVKHDDAVRALDQIAGLVRARATGQAPPPYAPLRGFAQPVRYPGHDRRYGFGEEDLRDRLLVWLFGSGRYQRYIWPLVAGEREFQALGGSSEEKRPEEIRDALAVVLARWLTSESAMETVKSRLWCELDFLDELDAELARWYAVRRLAAGATETADSPLKRVRADVAIAHGATSWNSLLQHVSAGRLFGAIPMEWVTEACDLMARARRAARSPEAARSEEVDVAAPPGA
jgi:hypothetical protein